MAMIGIWNSGIMFTVGSWDRIWTTVFVIEECWRVSFKYLASDLEFRNWIWNLGNYDGGKRAGEVVLNQIFTMGSGI